MTEQPQESTPTPQPPAPGSFDLNQPTVVALLYIASFFSGGLTNLVGVVLAYIWKGQPKAEWEASHYEYSIRTFWLGFGLSIIGIFLSIIGIGILIIFGALVLVIVRAVLSMLKAQKHEPMPNPGSWTI
ncbi:MAG: hypothetical protein H6918_00320 [Sphingomonadaceae bacterium]|nr:hypothetical protein [Sphingomonadaceae bacterium]